MKLIKLLFIFSYLVLSTCLDAIAEDASPIKMVPKKPALYSIVNELISTMPENACKEGGFLAACFKVEKELCTKDFRLALLNCADPLKKQFETNTETVRCESREHCSAQFGKIGQDLGQTLGSCAGEKYGLQHCTSFQETQCIKFLESSGMPKSEMENLISKFKSQMTP